jgi:sialate O-acetylesterase
MVIQRDKPFTVKGEAAPLAEVSVDFAEHHYDTQCDKEGRFSATLGSFSANSRPQSLKITSGEDTLTISNIVIGDVWLLAGQSNMELWLSRTAHNYPDSITDDDPLIRQFAVPQVPKFDGPRDSLDLSESQWQELSERTAPGFSAVGYFLAKQLRKRYEVPVGLIATAVGGTPIAAWLNGEVAAASGIDLTVAKQCADSSYVANMEKSESAATAAYMENLNNSDLGLSGNWAAPEYDASDWESAELTDYALGSGSHWYRKTIPVPADLGDTKAEIYLGTAIDMDEIFINGDKVGTTYYRYPPRLYSFILPKDTVTIAVRLLAFSGGGEFTPGKNRFIATELGTLSLDGPWRRRTGALVDNAPSTTFIRNYPTGLYNGMIAPLAGIQLRGIAWYQGESDTGNPAGYSERLAALITSWRELFDDSELPFLIQQLAHWDHTGPGGSDAEHQNRWEQLRLEQKRVLELPYVGLSGGYDVGEWNDLHPQGKQIVGERLARLAQRLAYREKLPPNMFEQFSLNRKAGVLDDSATV